MYACATGPKNDTRDLKIVGMYRYNGMAAIAQPIPKAANNQVLN
jgi:hypothetical protein